MTSSPANNDVVAEILTNLPVKSLLRFRGVSKLWHDIIDSPSFRKFHKNSTADATVLLAFNLVENRVAELSLIDERGQSSSLSLNNYFPNIQKFFIDYTSMEKPPPDIKVAGPVNGLICITHQKTRVPIAVCNPFLDQLKKLPISPILDKGDNSCCIISHDIGIGLDKDDDYKVVQLLSFYGRHRLHAEVYSTRTNSWRELAVGVLDQASDVSVVDTIHSHSSSCKPSSVVHWLVFVDGVHTILTFDVESEVFRTRMLPDWGKRGCIKIFAKDDDTFLLFRFYNSTRLRLYDGSEFDREVRICELRSCEGNYNDCRLRWDYLDSVPLSHILTSTTLWRRDYMVLDQIGFLRKELCFYDYRARKFLGCFVLPRHWRLFEIIQYQGTFISP